MGREEGAAQNLATLSTSVAAVTSERTRGSDKKPMDSTSVNSSETRREVKIMNGYSPHKMSAPAPAKVESSDGI